MREVQTGGRQKRRSGEALAGHCAAGAAVIGAILLMLLRLLLHCCRCMKIGLATVAAGSTLAASVIIACGSARAWPNMDWP